MRYILALGVATAAALFVAPQANAASTWCSIDETVSCNFSSLQQCIEGANSTNAICEPSNYAEDQVGAPRVRRPANR